MDNKIFRYTALTVAYETSRNILRRIKNILKKQIVKA
jgi:hypothetical protein